MKPPNQMTDAERLAEGLLIFLKKPGPTQQDFQRWTQILGAHHMHTRVLIQLAEKILHERDTPTGDTPGEATTPVPPNSSGEIHEPGSIIESQSSSLESTGEALRNYSSAERTIWPMEPSSKLDGQH